MANTVHSRDPAIRYRSATRPPRRKERAATAAAPRAWTEPFTTSDGRALVLRPIEPGDAEALRRAFARLTPEQVRLRLFHRVNELPLEVARRMAAVDPDKTIAYVAVDAAGEIRGEARIHVDEVTDTGEFAVAVDPAFTQQGIGRRLMTRLAEDARRRGLYEVWGDVLADNRTMLEFVKTLGAERRSHPDEPSVVRVSLRLRP